MFSKKSFRLFFFFLMMQILSLMPVHAYVSLSNKCIEIDGMYMNFDQYSSAAYMSPLNGGSLIKVHGTPGFEPYTVMAYITDKFKHEITIEYVISTDTQKYTKKVVTKPTAKENSEKDMALKKGIPFEYKFKVTENTSGEWKFIECKGRK